LLEGRSLAHGGEGASPEGIGVGHTVQQPVPQRQRALRVGRRHERDERVAGGLADDRRLRAGLPLARRLGGAGVRCAAGTLHWPAEVVAEPKQRAIVLCHGLLCQAPAPVDARALHGQPVADQQVAAHGVILVLAVVRLKTEARQVGRRHDAARGVGRRRLPLAPHTELARQRVTNLGTQMVGWAGR